MSKYARILRLVNEMPWAILPSKLAVIRDLLAFRAAGGQLTAEEVNTRLEAASKERAGRGNGKGVAVLPLVGTIIPRADLISESSGAVSVQRFTRALREAVTSKDVGGIVIDVDSPGGQVGGVSELANEIFKARGQKRITAVANGLAASAAYWIAAAADELVVTPTGQVGSIGVFAMHEDVSGLLEREGVAVNLISAGRYKVEGNPFEPLSDEARGAIQAQVDDYYNIFTSDVARFRGVSQSAVIDGFGEGRVVGSQAAMQSGMVDRVATMDEVIADMVGDVGAKNGRSKAYRKQRLRAVSR